MDKGKGKKDEQPPFKPSKDDETESSSTPGMTASQIVARKRQQEKERKGGKGSQSIVKVKAERQRAVLGPGRSKSDHVKQPPQQQSPGGQVVYHSSEPMAASWSAIPGNYEPAEFLPSGPGLGALAQGGYGGRDASGRNSSRPPSRAAPGDSNDEAAAESLRQWASHAERETAERFANLNYGPGSRSHSRSSTISNADARIYPGDAEQPLSRETAAAPVLSEQRPPSRGDTRQPSRPVSRSSANATIDLQENPQTQLLGPEQPLSAGGFSGASQYGIGRPQPMARGSFPGATDYGYSDSSNDGSRTSKQSSGGSSGNKKVFRPK